MNPSVTTLWGEQQHKDVFVVGTGTSLKDFDWGQLNDCVTIGLNDAVKFFNPTYHLWSDHPIWTRYEQHPYGPQTKIVCREDGARDITRSHHFQHRDKIYLWERCIEPKLADKGDNRLFISHTVATAGLQLAWKLGAARVFLLGIDAYSHVHATYADGSRQLRHGAKLLEQEGEIIFLSKHKEWCDEMHELRLWFDKQGLYQGPFPGCGIYNLSPLSRIFSFQRIDKVEAGLH